MTKVKQTLPNIYCHTLPLHLVNPKTHISPLCHLRKALNT